MEKKIKTGCSDMELIMEMMEDTENKIHNDKIDPNKESSYYEGKAINILKQFKEGKDYFYFLRSILKDYHILSIDEKEEIKKIMGIEKEIVIREKIVYKNNKKKQNSKPKINNYDDY
tara:strand:+ start:747 stop:1097 length:351 start_codon:yes stop_codon:yes gene_type:complete